MQKLVWQNANGVELDLTSGNYGITEWEGFSNASLNIQSQQVPFQDGGVFLDALIEQRELSVTLAMQDNNNLELRYQNRRELISALNPKLGEGYLIYTNDFISKRIKCVPQIPLFETHNSDTVGTPKASLSWTACNPYWEDLEETEVSISLGDTVTINNTGDVPAQIIADIQEGCDNPIITNKTTGKNIGLNALVESGILVNTNSGQKSIEAYTQEYQKIQGGTFTSCAYGNGKFLYAGTSIMIEDVISGERKTYVAPTTDAPSNLKYVNNLWFWFRSSTLRYSQDGINWTSVSGQTFNPQSYALYDIVYGNGKYVVVGNNGLILVSSDLQNWTDSSQGSDGLHSVAYSEELKMFVVGGASGVIWTSTNTTSWTQRTSGVSNTILNIIYAGLFVAVAGTNVLYSTNGISWSYVQGADSSLSRICYGNGAFVALGAGNRVYYSEDLNTWTKVKDTDYSSTSIGLDYGSGMFKLSCVNIRTIYKSTNGSDWEEELNWDYTIYNIAVGDKYVAIDSNNNSWVSADGKSWTQYPIGITGLEYITYAFGMFIAVGNSGKIATSTDGVVWTQQTSGVNYNLRRIKYFKETQTVVILDNADNGKILYSTNGTSWTEILVNNYYVRMPDIAYGDGKYLIIGTTTNGNNRAVLTSPDLQQWSYTTSATLTITPNVIVYNNMFVGIYSNYVMTSKNGTDWTLYLNPWVLTGTPTDAIVVNSKIYVVGGSGFAYSITNSNFAKVRIPNSSLYGITYKNNKFVMVGTEGSLIVSELDKTNFISNLSPSSDMNLNLEQGNNELSFFADATGGTCKIKYRQKYIGV